MSRHDYFSQQAAEYARHRPHYPDALPRFLAEIAPGRRAVWDCATGSGQAALGLAKHFDHVVATDLSAEQLACASPHPRVDYAVMAAEAAALPAEAFDLVTVATALHWLDLTAFYGEVRRVLAPGGVLAAWSYYGSSVSPAVDAVMRRYVDEVLAADWPEQIDLARDGYRGLPFPFEELPAPELAIALRWKLVDFVGYLQSWSPRQRHMARTQADPIDAIAGDLARAWGDVDRARTVRWPLFMRVGRLP